MREWSRVYPPRSDARPVPTRRRVEGYSIPPMAPRNRSWTGRHRHRIAGTPRAPSRRQPLRTRNRPPPPSFGPRRGVYFLIDRICGDAAPKKMRCAGDRADPCLQASRGHTLRHRQPEAGCVQHPFFEFAHVSRNLRKRLRCGDAPFQILPGGRYFSCTAVPGTMKPDGVGQQSSPTRFARSFQPSRNR